MEAISLFCSQEIIYHSFTQRSSVVLYPYAKNTRDVYDEITLVFKSVKRRSDLKDE